MIVPPPPPAPAGPVVDAVHGVDVADPYRWLEDGAAPATRSWVAAHDDRTRAVLDALPQRGWAHRRLVDLLAAPTSTACRLAADTVFAMERGGERQQAVLVARSALDPAAPARTLVDPAADGDATAAVDWYHPSPDGRLVAYGTSSGGDERSTLRVLDVGSGTPLGEDIPHTRAASVAWLPDASAFAYTRYPAQTAAQGRDRQVWWHVVGDDPAADAPLLTDLPDPTAWPDVALSPDGRWLVVHVALGWSRVDVRLLDRADGRWTSVVEGEEAVTVLEVAGDRLVGRTTLDAPRGRIVSAPLADPVPARWTTLVPEGPAVVEAVAVAGDRLLVACTDVGVARLHGVGLDGTDLGEVPLPGAVALAGLDADADRPRAFLQLESFTTPAALHRWTPDEGVVPWGAAAEGDASPPVADHVVEQVTYPSTDGVRVPMFLVRRAATRPGPGTPTLLTGYGGFGISMTPGWSASVAAWCEAGGVVAVAGLRGGSEHGEEWHDAGKRERKPQVFDDFAAAADWLVADGRTSRERLAVRGGSNGGLLVAGATTRRPDLCRAAVAAVPLTDMVRYHRFLIGHLWVPEYGDPEVAEDFAVLHGYSPYHRVVDGTCYPATLVTTADHDSRVDPAHARKLVARLLAATACGDERPVLLREERDAGHGAGKPLARQADEGADVLAFLLWQLGVGAPGLDGDGRG